MTSNLDHAKHALTLIGGDETINRLKARGVESTEKGLRFVVPLLGGLVQVQITRGDELWDIELGVDVLQNIPRRISEIPDHNLKLIVHHLFVL